MDKKMIWYSNIIFTLVLIGMIWFAIFMKSEGGSCAINPCRYILEKENKTWSYCGAGDYGQEEVAKGLIDQVLDKEYPQTIYLDPEWEG
jgi:hypothetical protein|tara:strand:+ start:361 stop:627 length:267 start_codon:yes stop_codon:yes gene_type:complete